MAKQFVSLVFLVLSLLVQSISYAGESWTTGTGLFDGTSLEPVSLSDIVAKVEPGGVLIVSEQHGSQAHYDHQKQALKALANSGRCTVSVGLEFLSWIYQDSIRDFKNGTISESDFLTKADWPSNPFADYRDQALFPRITGGELIGLNAPRSLTGAAKTKGLSGLTPEQLSLVPPSFQLGNNLYRERFDNIMAPHVPATALDGYFLAQSLWDDSMAWQASDFLKSNPSHCLAVIVGDFHAAWGGGLPDRLRARGISNVIVISQMETAPLSASDLADEVQPHVRYGMRADAIWLNP